jgi:hypothetical protein
MERDQALDPELRCKAQNHDYNKGKLSSHGLLLWELDEFSSGTFTIEAGSCQSLILQIADFERPFRSNLKSSIPKASVQLRSSAAAQSTVHRTRRAVGLVAASE